MKILLIAIVIHITTIVVLWSIGLRHLRQEYEEATVGDIIRWADFWMYVPIFNISILVVFTIMHIIYNRLHLPYMFDKLWDKIKNIKL